ncbi:hypothetical protein TR13x_10480 [Caloranaerobacter sp. TR13]|uniref:hypothetical protein n=1 Tax=Caloranaerobacter sp. TR13 TaxID=1302151 RepID=UPI0006D47B39|nr:hypothetical protein [Caloranaerobacter sp. TR13]KPU26360.1 hypothetical protein TR13x_10480 [Caloranaerobacter sp. TR13]
MKKFNKYIYFGMFLNGLWLISNRFNLLPDFIEGLCVGAGVTFILIGMYAENHVISELRNYKKSLLNRVFGK